MKSVFVTVILTCIIILNLTAQGTNPIIIEKKVHKTPYQQNGKFLTHKELAAVLKSNQYSIKEYKKSAALSNTGVVLVFTGIISSGLGVVSSGLSLISHLYDKNDKASQYLTYSGITLLSGLGLMTIGIAFGVNSESHFKKSINDYNGSLKNQKSEATKIYFNLKNGGIGVLVRF